MRLAGSSRWSPARDSTAVGPSSISPAGLQGGTVTLLATAHPFDSVTTFDIRRAALDSVDLGTLLGQPGFAGPVTLGATGQGRWGASEKFVKARVTIEPSRLGHVDVEEGSLDAELAGDRLGYGAVVRTNAGVVTLQGDGRPMADVPAYQVREGRLESLDLGPLLGRDSLRTDLTARFTGSMAGSGLDSMLARLDLELQPSRVNQAELSEGRVTLGLERGALEGTLRLAGRDASANARLTGHLGADTSRVRADGDVSVERLARWTADTAADGRLEGRFGIDAVADSTGLLSAGGTITAAGGVGDVQLQQLYLALRPVPGAIELDTLTLRSNVATLDGSGRLRPARRVVLPIPCAWSGRAGDLTPLALLAGADSIALDSTLLDLTVTGPADRRKVEGHADVFRAPLRRQPGRADHRARVGGCGHQWLRRGRRHAADPGRRRRQGVAPRGGSRRPLRLADLAPGHRRRERRRAPGSRSEWRGTGRHDDSAAVQARSDRRRPHLAARAAGRDHAPSRCGRGGWIRAGGRGSQPRRSRAASIAVTRAT